MTTNTIYELPFPGKLVLERKEEDILMQFMCKYLHARLGYNVLTAKLAFTTWGHYFSVYSKVEGDKGVEDASVGHCYT